MPILIDRRGFFRVSASALALSASLPAAESAVSVALLSDTHIAADPNDTFRGFYPRANLRKVVDQVTKTQPRMMIVNGDLARMRGEMQDYAAFTSLIKPLTDTLPMTVTMGNHDDRENARKSLANLNGDRQPVLQKLVTVLDAGPCTFVLLDSLMTTAATPGLLGKAQRDWLTAYLNEPSAKPVVIFVHHNPDGDSDIGLLDADRLLAMLKPHKQVKALLYGHTHEYAFDFTGGIHLINLPAVGYNFADGNPVGWIESTFTGKGASLTLHAVAGELSADGRATKLDWRS